MFWGCSCLETITVPASVKKIGSHFADECASLRSINVSEGNTAFISSEGVLYDKNLTRLISVPGAMESLTVPNSVKVVEEMAFMHSKAIKSVVLPNSLESIGNWAFNDCKNLETISAIPSTLKSIGICAFTNCEKLNCEIEIPAATEDIKEGVFFGTTSLKGLSVNPDNIYYASKGGVIYDKYFTKIITAACGYSEYEIAETAKTIGEFGFCGNTNLKYFRMPDKMEEIEISSFNGCKQLEVIMFGNNFKNISGECFRSCNNIKTIISKNPTPPNIGGGFTDRVYENAVVYVPVGSSADYNSSAWKVFNIVESDDLEGIYNSYVGVEGIAVDAQDAVPLYFFSIDGRRVSANYKGIVIVRYSDGRTKRVMNR